MDVTVLAVGLFIALAAGAWFFSLEIAGKQVDVVIVLLVVLVLDVVVYPESETAELPSYLNLSLGSQAIRLLQILLVAAVVARLLADGIPRRFTAAAPLWMAFFLWFLVSAVVGWLFGNASGLILRHLLLVVVIGAGLLVAGGVRAVDYVQSRNLQRFLVCAAVASVLLFITD